MQANEHSDSDKDVGNLNAHNKVFSVFFGISSRNLSISCPLKDMEIMAGGGASIKMIEQHNGRRKGRLRVSLNLQFCFQPYFGNAPEVG
jgi:hypothetical protein